VPKLRTSSLLDRVIFLSYLSYRIAVAGVRKKLPATTMEMNGRPKRANGYFLTSRRYWADPPLLDGNLLDWKVLPIVAVAGGFGVLRVLCSDDHVIYDG
jgi:hypothetical protein